MAALDHLDFTADELAANDRLTAGESSVETFLDTVSAFMATDDNPTLGAFLSWIEDVERRERLSPVDESPEGDVVQLLTIHGSKGLEWDFVAVGRMIADDKRTVTTNIEKWTDFGALPEQLRADRADLGAVWRFEDATDQLDLEDSYETYLDSARTRYDIGERRLAYVALTRSAKDMLLSGSWWASGKTRRSPSVYLAEIIEAGLAASPPPEEPVETENPWDPRAASVVWPLPPLGAREPRVRAAAARVLRLHAGAVTAVALLPGGRLATGGQDGQVAILATLVSSSARPEELDAVVARLRRVTVATDAAWLRSPLF
jgi:DNA helicase-2/ATP-dependent DNA helicase PcrA